MRGMVFKYPAAAGTILALAASLSAQPQLVHSGRLPSSPPDYQWIKLDVVKKIDTSFRVLVQDTSVLHFMSGNLYIDWLSLFYMNLSYEMLPEIVANQQGQTFLYIDDIWSDENDSIYFQWNVAVEGRYCPGRPVIDASGAIHVIWISPDSSEFYYGLSRDTLATFEFQDTVSFPWPLRLHRLVTSPNDSLIAAIFANVEGDSVYKYLSPAGQRIDFDSPPAVFGGFAMPYDVTLDKHGEIIAVGWGDNGYDVGECPNWAGRCHWTWTETQGYRFVDDANDDVFFGTAFQFSFGENDEILLVENGTPPFGYIDMAFFVSFDSADTWLRSEFTPSNYQGFYGSMPRTFTDTVDFFYYEWPDNVYYHPIPRDSIFLNLVASDEGDEPIPANFALFNFPNPFNSQTVISFTLPSAGHVKLDVIDIQGRIVIHLADRQLSAGIHCIPWNGLNAIGREISSGIYFYRLSSDKPGTETRRMVLLK